MLLVPLCPEQPLRWWSFDSKRKGLFPLEDIWAVPLSSAHLFPDRSQTVLHSSWPHPWQPRWYKLLHSIEGDIAPPQKTEQKRSVLAQPSGEVLPHITNLLHHLSREGKPSPSSGNYPTSVALLKLQTDLKLQGRALQHFSGTKRPYHASSGEMYKDIVLIFHSTL